MRKKVRSEGKNAQKKNEVDMPPNAATPIKNDKTPVKTSTTPNKLSTSESLTRRPTLGRAKDGGNKTVTPSEKATAAPTMSKKATTSPGRTNQTKRLAPPKKVVLAKKAIVAKTMIAVKKKDAAAKKKILTKAKMVKAKNTSTKRKINLPSQVEKDEVRTLGLDFKFVLFWSLV